ncbi:MAG: TIGR01906 family membrane protein [Clostridiales bacterium]|nr:TIGR01906 family membrane protein [Clostridiales bacterium]
MKNKILTILFIISLTFLAITVSIGLPIYFRFFYYLHINALDLPNSTGYDYQTIKCAFDEMMNYLTLPGVPFSTGDLAFSPSGASHFADCKKLFNLNLIVLIISFVITLTLIILERKKVFSFYKFFNKKPCFFSGIINLVLPLTIGAVASINFNKAFTIFHKIFFPGKDNWQFSPYKDEIIKVLPQEFFMNSAILIGAGLVIISIIFIILGVKKNRKTKNPIDKT